MTDSNQKGVAHRHPRPVPSRKRFDETFMMPMITDSRGDKVEWLLPDNNTFGHLDLRALVDDLNEGGDE